MKVYILDNGWLECDENWMVALSTVGTLENKTPKINWIKIPVYSVLIDHPEGKILYDTGCHPNAMKGYWSTNLKSIFPYFYEEHQTLENQLKLIGITPEEIKTVVMSHLHLDHAGNLGLFKNADVYVHRKDYDYAKKLINSSDDRGKHGAYIKEDVEAPVKSFKFVEEDFSIAEKVDIITLPGHTPGLLGVITHLEEGSFIFPQDALYTRNNYEPTPKASGIMYDSIAFFKSIDKIKKLEKKYNAKVMFSHDMEFFKTMKLAPNFYS